MQEQDEKKKNKIISAMSMFEKYLGSIFVGICCIFNILWLFFKEINYTFKLGNLENMVLKVFSVIWIVGFLLYAFIVIFLQINKKGKTLHIIRVVILAVMAAEIFWNQWLMWSSVPVCLLLALLLLLFCLNLIENKNEEFALDELEKNSLKYRDDRKFFPVLLSKIKSEDLKAKTANEVGTYIYSAYKYKRRFYSFTLLSVALPAIVVAINSIESLNDNASNVAVSLLSMATVIVTGIMSTMKARESWVRNREFAERAKSEIFNCIMKIGEYEEAKNEEALLAVRLEELYMEERGQWKKLRGGNLEKQEGK